LKEAVKYKKCSFVWLCSDPDNQWLCSDPDNQWLCSDPDNQWLCSDPDNQASFHCRTAFRTLITKVFSAGR